MKKLTLLAIACVMFSSQSFAHPFCKGSFSVGGAGRVPLKWDAAGYMSMGVDVAPSASWFFSDGWELNGSLRVDGVFYQHEFVRAPREPMHYGLAAGVNRYFDVNWGIQPYVGAAIGFSISDFKLISSKLYLEMPMGIAIVANENLLIQIGAPLRVSFEPPGVTTGTMHLEWSPGYIGAQVFL